MGIKKDRLDEFAVWTAYMQTIGELTAISFFNYICFCREKGSDAVKIVSSALELQECDRPYCVTLKDIYMAMCAFSNFHELGDDFRRRWNTQALGDLKDGGDYAVYIEEGVIKHVVRPYVYHSILDSGLFTDDDEGEDDDDPDTWKGPEQ